MTIKTIERSLSREYNVFGLKEWKGARMVAEIIETEDEYECGKELERRVERQLTDNRHSSGEFINALDLPEFNKQPIPSINKQAERAEIMIENAEDVKELESYYDEALKWELIPQYTEKMGQLLK